MIFSESGIDGAFLIGLEKHSDDRGFFARVFCKKEFEAKKLESSFPQISVSSNLKKGTFRGLHFQSKPYEETKVVRCSHGSIYDVVLDLRPSSPSYLKWKGFELSAVNGNSLYIPRGCAHGFLTLEDNTEVTYMIDLEHKPGFGRGYSWNDPKFGITLPLDVLIISERDATYPAFDDKGADK